MALGLPLLNPYLAKTASFDNGINFAVARSTALNISFFYAKGVIVPPFMTYLNSICSTPTECADKLSKSLVFVGETGVNDIIIAFQQGRSVEEILTYMSLVNQVIINTTKEVIQAGASQVVVPGNFPLGCFPIVLSASRSNDPTAYDDLGCLKSLNNLTTFQNNYLQEALGSLRKEFPNVVILYADYYNTFQLILHEASTLGFNTTTLLKPCCGVEGQYNALNPIFCGNLGVPVCSNPNIYIHWDGVHLTQEAYRRISEILIKNLKINCTE
ncbi:hypothetical protein Pfo_016318 [Paulownia fortunei]|nr:hypothetical protein Pfo_016318 [Paulownia fortunei]